MHLHTTGKLDRRRSKGGSAVEPRLADLLQTIEEAKRQLAALKESDGSSKKERDILEDAERRLELLAEGLRTLDSKPLREN
jgi:hypothetical protein